MKKSLLLLSVILGLFSLQSCEIDSFKGDQDGLVAPKLPPQGMLTMPTATFDSGFAAEQEADSRSFDYKNWLHAGVSLAVWHGITVAVMATPTAAFEYAFNFDPEYIGDDTFLWSYSVSSSEVEGGASYDIELTGQYLNNYTQVEWIMTASEIGGFTDFVWYTGIMNIGVEEALFTLYDQPYDPIQVLEVKYKSQNSGNNNTLRFTNIKEGSPDLGDYIEYRVQNNEEYNRAFDVFQSDDNFLEIEWDEPAMNGRVKHELFFEDSEWHCWNTEGRDTDC